MAGGGPHSKPPRISVIIPALNEETNIEKTLDALEGVKGLEVIVVDGGSGDNTLGKVRQRWALICRSAQGRALQMNLGARWASGEYLLFLHADTVVEEGFEQKIGQTLANPQVAAGAFSLRIDDHRLWIRVIEFFVGLRSRLGRLPYGDQGFFMRRETFRRSGGFSELPIMEDFDFIRRLKRMGRIHISSLRVITSGRRWQQGGILRTTLVNQLIVLAYLLGVSPARLRDWYRRTGRKGLD